MEAQLDRQPGHHYDGVPPAGVNSGVQDEVDEQPHEKKSMFRKVKDKARKIKHAMTKHGNGGHDDDEDDDDETVTTNEDSDEMDVDPALHASPAAVPGGSASNAPAHHGLASEKPSDIREDPYSIQKTEPEETNGLPLPVIPEKRVLNPTSVKDEGIKHEGVKFGDLEDLEDAKGLKGGSNYQTKSIDHTGKGGKEADVASLIQSFEKTGIHGDSSDHSGLHGDSSDRGDLRDYYGVPSGVHGDSGVSGGLHGDSGVPGGVHGDSAPKVAELRESYGNIGGHDAPLDAGTHDQFAPESFPTEKAANLTGIRDHFPSESFPAGKITNPTGSHDQLPSESFPTDKTANPTGSYDQLPSESFSFDKTANPSGIHDQFPSESFPTGKTANPTDSSFPPETVNPSGNQSQFPSFPKSSDHIKPEQLHHDTTEPKPTDQGSYIGMITSAVPSVITDTAISAKNAVASKLGYGPTKDAEAPRTTDDIAGDAKLGYGETKHADAPRTEGIAGATDYSSREFDGSEKPATITDKVVSAKNVVASKLGYGSTTNADTPGTKAIPRATEPVETLETGEEESAKPSSITDKVISAKNAVASKLGYGDTNTETPTTEHVAGATKPVSGLETGEVQGTTKPSSPSYVKGVTAKVTDTLAPVYAKVADTGSSVMSRVTGAGTGGKEGGTVSGDDKGTSVKDYLYEKFTPGEEEKALSREITDALHVRKENPSEKVEKEPKTLGKVVDATGEEPLVLAEAKKEGDEIRGVGSEKVNKGVVKDTVSSWVGMGGGGGGQESPQQHTQGSSDSHDAGIAVPLPGETGHPSTVAEDKNIG